MALKRNAIYLRKLTNHGLLYGHAWYYETPKGLEVFYVDRGKTNAAFIPAGHLRRYLHRLDSKDKDGE